MTAAACNRQNCIVSKPKISHDSRVAGRKEQRRNMKGSQSIAERVRKVKHILETAMASSACACLIVLLFNGNVARAQEATPSPLFSANLSSFSQVPSVLAGSSGSFLASLTPEGVIVFSLSYSNMSSPVTQAHIHFGAGRTNGGVAVFLCGGPKPACPVSGTVTGVITAADVSTLPVGNPDSVIPQGIQPGDLAGLVRAVRAGKTYINVHTTNFPNGELRGQVKIANFTPAG
jgi:CHRD domain